MCASNPNAMDHVTRKISFAYIQSMGYVVSCGPLSLDRDISGVDKPITAGLWFRHAGYGGRRFPVPRGSDPSGDLRAPCPRPRANRPRLDRWRGTLAAGGVE